MAGYLPWHDLRLNHFRIRDQMHLESIIFVLSRAPPTHGSISRYFHLPLLPSCKSFKRNNIRSYALNSRNRTFFCNAFDSNPNSRWTKSNRGFPSFILHHCQVLINHFKHHGLSHSLWHFKEEAIIQVQPRCQKDRADFTCNREGNKSRCIGII